MASKVGICNLALTRIGKELISDVTADTAAAIACNAVYEYVLDALLSQTAWNFATRSAALAEVTDEYTNYDYAYAYPTDCLWAMEIVNDVSEDPIEFEVVSNSTGTQRQAELRYVSRVSNPNLYSASFIMALSAKLAIELAGILVGDPARVAALTQYYQQVALPEARGADAREGCLPARQRNDMVEARE
jgi:hypothetical protein